MRKFCYLDTQTGKKIGPDEFHESALESEFHFSFCLLNCSECFFFFLRVFYPLSCILGIYYVLIIISDLCNTFGLSPSSAVSLYLFYRVLWRFSKTLSTFLKLNSCLEALLNAVVLKLNLLCCDLLSKFLHSHSLIQPPLMPQLDPRDYTCNWQECPLGSPSLRWYGWLHNLEIISRILACSSQIHVVRGAICTLYGKPRFLFFFREQVNIEGLFSTLGWQ